MVVALPVNAAPITFTPVADALVTEASPTTAFGTSTALRVDGGADPDVQTYLRFTVTGVTGTIQSRHGCASGDEPDGEWTVGVHDREHVVGAGDHVGEQARDQRFRRREGHVDRDVDLGDVRRDLARHRQRHLRPGSRRHLDRRGGLPVARGGEPAAARDHDPGGFRHVATDEAGEPDRHRRVQR